MPINIMLDGTKVSAVETKEEVEIEVPSNEMTLHATQYGISSNKVLVDDGDILVIKTSVTSHIIMCAFFFLLIITSIFSNIVLENIWLYIGIVLTLLLLMLSLDQYSLEIIDKTEWKRNADRLIK
ncbi:hypothetical protein JCM19029_01490 [Salinicoccus sesuvii]